MDRGGFSAALAQDVLRFNGKLFKGAAADGFALRLTPGQIDGLLRAAQANWREVEPAIFGTLLERALHPDERHALGAHYTPRAYVERLVLPTVVEPLRADWANAQAAALLLAREADDLEGKKREAKLDEARAEIRRFHHQLCSTRVLDPACGSGNFLYVTLEHLKRLEGEVLIQLEALGDSQVKLGLEGETVTLQQLRGIEINERAAALAELVLWLIHESQCVAFGRQPSRSQVRARRPWMRQGSTRRAEGRELVVLGPHLLCHRIGSNPCGPVKILQYAGRTLAVYSQEA